MLIMHEDYPKQAAGSVACRPAVTMRRTGRTLLSVALIICTVTSTNSFDYAAPVEIQLWDTGRTPLAHMVDVTNEFGLKILAEHNFLNDNNIAFSPYGLTGIMIALFEGVSGDSSFQIQTGMQLPWSRNVMRIGFRDIHRTLKTYFVPEEGFLAGLALNNDNVTFNENYKKILRFYGFALEKEQIPTLPPTTPEISTQVTTIETTSTAVMTTGASSETPAREDVTSSPVPEQTTNPNAETIDVNVNTSTTAMPTENAAVESSTSPATEATTTEKSTQAETTIQTSTAPTEPPAATEQESTVNNEVETIPPSESGQIATSETPSPGENVNTASTMSTQMEQMSTISEMDATTMANDSTLETLERKKKSIVDFIFTNPPYVDDYLVYRSSYDVPSEVSSKIPYVGEKMFLVNGLRNVEVNYMHFDTVLDHAFLPHLEATALRLPLDSDRYYLLVVLPSRGGVIDLGRLIARMSRESNLRDVHAAMRPRRVRAVVPSFTVKGHVTLTTDLQKLGIRDVFEPRQRDFTPMTPQPGVYVRSVEQAVSVAIRKYRPDQVASNRYSASQPPVHFSATYPFVYFVMDASIHVALMAGKMADPLNSRIL